MSRDHAQEQPTTTGPERVAAAIAADRGGDAPARRVLVCGPDNSPGPITSGVTDQEPPELSHWYCPHCHTDGDVTFCGVNASDEHMCPPDLSCGCTPCKDCERLVDAPCADCGAKP